MTDKIDDETFYELVTEKKKVRLNFAFEPDSHMVETFATMIRRNFDENFYGLRFFDIPDSSLAEIKNTVGKLAFC